MRGSLLAKERARILSKVKAQDPDLAKKLESFNLDWFRVKNAASEDEADVYIYDEIVPQWVVEWFGEGVSAESLIAQLNEISASTINVRINSPGGALFEAIAIYNALMAHSSTINVYVDSIAASAASIIAMAGDKITMMVGSQMMIHDAMGIEMGNAAQLREFATFLDKQSDNVALIYAEKSGGNPDDFRSLMLAETWLYAQEAVDLGVADEVYERGSNKNKAMPMHPDEGDEPDPEDPGESGEDEPPEDEVDEDAATENKMRKRHSLSARGFKYAGRKRAPDPIDLEVNEIMAALGKKVS